MLLSAIEVWRTEVATAGIDLGVGGPRLLRRIDYVLLLASYSSDNGSLNSSLASFDSVESEMR